MHAVFAFPALLGLAWLISENRRAIRWRTVLGGIGLQVVFALLLFRLPPARAALRILNDGAEALQEATDRGTAFVFGYLAGPPLPFAETQPGAAFILAFKALPLVLTISAVSALLFHWGVLQRIAAGFAFVLRRTLGVGGALSLGAAVHVFVGMIEAPLLVRPYLAAMSRGELFALMSCGMAGVAGTVMVIYASVLGPVLPDALGVILAASVISTPAALAVSALMIPFGAVAADAAGIAPGHAAAGSFDALVKGTADGVAPLVAIATVLLVAVALVSLTDMALGHLPQWGGEPVSLVRLAAYPFRPVAWLIGLDWEQAGTGARLFATKTVLNEFVAYLKLAALPPGALGPRETLIMTCALCGFANLGSAGILIGGLSAMLPDRRQEVATLGARSIVSGTLATCLTGALAGQLAGTLAGTSG